MLPDLRGHHALVDDGALDARPRHSRVSGAGEQPVAQLKGGEAVVFVVVGECVKPPPGRGVVASGDHLDVLVIGNDRGAAVPDRIVVAGAQLVTHVEGLELLDAVGRAAHTHCSAHRGEQIDEDLRAEQRVELVLACLVAHGQALESSRLVRGVVVDVHVWVGHATRRDVVDELLERRAFLGCVVGPESGVVAVGIHEAPQVLQARRLARRVGVERVALEVEEEVPGRRFGQQSENRRRGVTQLEGQRGAIGGRHLLRLESRLGAQLRERLRRQGWVRGVGDGQRVQCGYPGSTQLATLVAA